MNASRLIQRWLNVNYWAHKRYAEAERAAFLECIKEANRGRT